MQRLNARNHSQLSEARNVIGGDGFDMLNPRSRVLCAVGSRSLLVGIQRGSHGLVANRMSEDLKLAIVQFRDRGPVL